MEVPARSKVGHIEVRGNHLEHGSRIGKNMTLAFMAQQDRDPRGCAAADALDASQVNAALSQPFQGYAAQSIASKPGNETDRETKRSQVVRNNGRRTAQSQAKVAGQQLVLQRHDFWKSIEDEVQIDLTRNRHIEALLHTFLVYECDNPGKMARCVGIEPLPQSETAAEQLPPHDIDN